MLCFACSKYIEENFPTETPPLFQLHNNAEIGFLLESSRALFVILSDLGGIVLSDNEEGGSGAGSALSMVDAFLEQTPSQFDADDLATRAEAHLTNPFVCVLLQEVQRMNLLLGTLVGSLQELKLGLDGALNMSDSMESLLETLPLDRVPATWAAYPSLKSLGAWFADLLTRIEVLSPWAETLETPVSAPLRPHPCFCVRVSGSLLYLLCMFVVPKPQMIGCCAGRGVDIRSVQSNGFHYSSAPSYSEGLWITSGPNGGLDRYSRKFRSGELHRTAGRGRSVYSRPVHGGRQMGGAG